MSPSAELPSAHEMALALVAQADEIARRITQETGRSAKLACFTLYSDEATIIPETATHFARRQFQFKMDPDVRGRFAGLLFFGADDSTIVRACRLGDRDAWCTPNGAQPGRVRGRAGLFSALDWAGVAYPSPRIEPGMQITLELSGPFVCVAFLVLKEGEPSN